MSFWSCQSRTVGVSKIAYIATTSWNLGGDEMIIYDKHSKYCARYRENEKISIEMTIDCRAVILWGCIDRLIFCPDPVIGLWAISHIECVPLWQPPLTIGWWLMCVRPVGCDRSTGETTTTTTTTHTPHATPTPHPHTPPPPHSHTPSPPHPTPRIISVSRRYSWSCLTGHNILSNSPGFRWAMPGMRIHWGAWSGNCVYARNPTCGNRLTTNWSWTSRVKRQVDTQSACRNDLLLAVATGSSQR